MNSASADLIPFHELKSCKIVSFDSTLWTPSDERIKKRIEKEWRKKQKKKGVLYNGPLVRANRMWQEGAVLYIEAQRTDYKTHAMTRDDFSIPEEQRGLGLYATALPLTIDGYIVLGVTKTSEKQYQGKVNVIAGGMEPKDVKIGEGLESVVARELSEETGIKKKEIMSIQPIYVTRERTVRHPAVVHRVPLRLTRKQTKEIFLRKVAECKGRGEEPELGELWFVRAERREIEREMEERSTLYQERVPITLKYFTQII